MAGPVPAIYARPAGATASSDFLLLQETTKIDATVKAVGLVDPSKSA
jgi:hypothetical protein